MKKNLILSIQNTTKEKHNTRFNSCTKISLKHNGWHKSEFKALGKKKNTTNEHHNYGIMTNPGKNQLYRKCSSMKMKTIKKLWRTKTKQKNNGCID